MDLELKQKLDLCKVIAQDLHEDSQSTQQTNEIKKTLAELTSFYKNYEETVNENLLKAEVDSRDLKKCSNEVQEALESLSDLEKFFDKTKLILVEDSLNTQQAQLKQVLESFNEKHAQTNEAFKPLVSKGVLNSNDLLRL